MRILVLSPTSLNEVQLCQRKFYFSKILNKIPRHKSEALEKGTLIHTFLEFYYKARMANAPILQARDIGIEMGRQSAINLELPIQETEVLTEIFRNYVEFYKFDPWKPVLVEQPFSKVLYERPDCDCVNPSDLVNNQNEKCKEHREGLKVLLEGKLDLAVELLDGSIQVVDHKSSSRFRKLSKLSNQYYAYAWATETKGLTINRVGLQKTFKDEERFTRPSFSFAPEELNKWVEETIFWCEFIVRCIETGHYPANFTSCDKFGGCAFRKVCGLPEGSWESQLRTHFTDKPEHNLFPTEETETDEEETEE